MKTIQLTQNKVALVDDADYEELAKYKWQAKKRGHSYYAVRSGWDSGKVIEISMHRAILRAPKGQHFDHINHNALDNRRANLRACTHTQNMGNMVSKTGVSCYKGVSWNKKAKRWVVQIQYMGHKIHLGYFLSEIYAAGVYDRHASKLFGEFACLNFPIQLAAVSG